MAETMMLKVDRLVVDLSGRRILKGVSLEVPKGGFTALMGPNGSGKTTLLRAAYRAVPRVSGAISIDGDPIDRYGARALARKVAVLRQETSLEFDFSVEEIVWMGRSPYKGLLEPDSADDRRIVEEAMVITGTADLRRRDFTALSGGERQRVLLARALAQQPALLLLDEPTSHLDIRHQLDLLARTSRLGVTVLAALHDLSLAMRFAKDAVLLKGGEVRASGRVADVLTEANVEEVFEVRAERVMAPNGEALFAFGVISR